MQSAAVNKPSGEPLIQAKLPNNKLAHQEAQQHFIKNKCKYIQPIATVFFRFSHRNKKNVPLTNQEQKQIVDKIYTQMTEYMEREIGKAGGLKQADSSGHKLRDTSIAGSG